jgi:WD40 repeat protein
VPAVFPPVGQRNEFSPDGRFLAAIYRAEGLFQVWDLDRRQRVPGIPSLICGVAWDFSPDGRRLAVARRDGSIGLHDLRELKEVKRLPPRIGLDYLAFHPDGRQLAVSCSQDPLRAVQICDLDLIVTLPHPGGVRGLSWRADGQRLATACGDAVYIWEAATFATGRPLLTLEGHQSTVTHVAFNQGGDLLASYSWDGMVRLWDPWTGHQLVASPGAPWIRFDREDRRLAGALVGDRVGIWEVATGREFRTLHGHLGRANCFADFSPDGRWLASASWDGVRLWDPAVSNEPIAFVPSGPSGSVLFHPEGTSLLISGSAGLRRWPIGPDPGKEGGYRIGSPQDLGVMGPYFQSHMSQSRDGRTLGVVRSRYQPGPGQAVVIPDLMQPAARVDLRADEGLESIAVSPEGRWVATGSWLGTGTTLWDLGGRTPGPIGPSRRLPTGDAIVGFSPDGRRLVTGSQAAYQFWEVGSWSPVGRPIPRDRANLRGPLAFSHDGSVLAIATSPREVQLIDPGTGGVLATLTAPDPQLISWLSFSPDGGRLAVASEGRVIQVWDLRLIRRQLARMHLDWGLPPLLTPAEMGPPIAVRVLPARAAPETDLKRLEREERWPELVDALGHLIDQDPRRADYPLQRGRAHSELGHWAEAAVDYARAVELEQAAERPRFEPWTRLALVRLALGDAAGYRHACTSLIERFGPTESRTTADAVAWACALAPDAVADGERPVQLARRAVAGSPQNHVFLNTLGAALYRVGRFPEAIQVLDQAVQAHGRGGAAWDWLLLAMSHQRLHHTDEAGRWLDQAISWIDRRDAGESRGRTPTSPLRWYQRVELQLLRREAEMVLERDKH